jgi:hypothetical protein
MLTHNHVKLIKICVHAARAGFIEAPSKLHMSYKMVNDKCARANAANHGLKASARAITATTINSRAAIK